MVHRSYNRFPSKTITDSDNNNKYSPNSMTEASLMSEQEKTKPIKSFNAGRVKASIWKNETDQDGQSLVRYSVQIQKQYKNNHGEWINTDSFFPDELPKLESVVRKSYEFILVKESKDFEEDIPI